MTRCRAPIGHLAALQVDEGGPQCLALGPAERQHAVPQPAAQGQAGVEEAAEWRRGLGGELRLLVADQLPHLAAERVEAHQPQRGAVRAGVEAGAGQRPLQPDQRAGRAGVQPRDAQLLVPVTCTISVSDT